MGGLSRARKTAYVILLTAYERDAYVRDILNSSYTHDMFDALSDADAGFVRTLVLGVTATYGTLDEVIDKFATKPHKMDVEVRCALRIATYEMLYLKKPAHVAVSQGVELVRLRAKSASGMANAVLRRISELPSDYLSSSPWNQYGMPEWLWLCFTHDVGEQSAHCLGSAQLMPAPVFLANMPMCIADQVIHASHRLDTLTLEPAGSIDGAWRVKNPSQLDSCISLTVDHAVICDYGAQMIAYLASVYAGSQLLEIGSGRGTKTMLMASHMYRNGSRSHIWSVEMHRFKCDIAKNRLNRAGIKDVSVVHGDGRLLDELNELPHEFDCVFIDAPCSGTGTLRRHPEIIWKLTPSDVASCASLQLDLLKSGSSRTKPGGVLIYSTCSVLREENEEVIQSFLTSPHGSEFEVISPLHLVRHDAIAHEITSLITPENFVRTFMGSQGCDGHFCACLRKRA